MSALASKLPSHDQVKADRARRGPMGECAIYGMGDAEDWTAVDELRHEFDWKTARRIVHENLGITKAQPDINKFRYHWAGKCWCWTPELKAWIEEQS